MPTPTDDTQIAYLDLPVQTRSADVRPGSWDEATRTVEVIASTGAMVRRYGWMSEYDEEIPVTEQVFDLGRFLTVGPVLDNHNAYGSALNAIGRVEAAKIEDRKLIATLKFDSDPTGDAIFQKIGRGILRAVSLGYDAEYERVRAKDREDGGDVDLYRATRVTPYEVSVVMMPADAGAVVRNQQPGANTRRYLVRDTTPAAPVAAPPKETPAEPVQERAMPTPENNGGAAALTSEQAEQIKREAVAAYTKRLAATQTLLRSVSLDTDDAPEMVARHADDGELNAEILRRIAARDAAQKPVNGAVRTPEIEVVHDGADKERRAIEFGIMHRMRPELAEKTYGGKLDDLAADFRGMRLVDIAKRCLESRGIRTRGMSASQVAEIALMTRGGIMSTSDFPSLLANSGNKLLMEPYQIAVSPWREWSTRRDRPDFKEFSLVRRSSAPELKKILEGGEIKFGKYSEKKEVGQLQTAGVILTFTRQMLVNDDLDAFRDQAAALGEAARDYEDDQAMDLILGGVSAVGATMNDGNPLFHADHANISDDTGGPDLTAVERAGEYLADQTAFDSTTNTRKLNWRITHLFGALKEANALDKIVNTTILPVTAGSGRSSLFTGIPCLHDQRVKAKAPGCWYAISAGHGGMMYGGLEGDPSPRLSMESMFGRDGISWELIHDSYSALADHRWIVKVPAG